MVQQNVRLRRYRLTAARPHSCLSRAVLMALSDSALPPRRSHAFGRCAQIVAMSGLKPILKPTGCENVHARANRHAVFAIRTNGRRRHPTPKFESPVEPVDRERRGWVVADNARQAEGARLDHFAARADAD